MSDRRTITVHPVVHVETLDQVRVDVAVVAQFRTGTTFLIQHEGDDRLLLDALDAGRAGWPGMAFGVNLIRRPAFEALRILGERYGSALPIADIWADTAGIETGQGAEFAEALATARKRHGWAGRHFGGLAFKHQTRVSDAELPNLARTASRFIDVVTTSGAATGAAAPTAKVRAIAAELGDRPLALASGVTAENVDEFRPWVSHVLVASGINDARGRIDPGRLEQLLTRAGERPED